MEAYCESPRWQQDHASFFTSLLLRTDKELGVIWSTMQNALYFVANSKFGKKGSEGYDEFNDYEQYSSDEEMTTSDIDRSHTPGNFYTGEEADADSMEY